VITVQKLNRESVKNVFPGSKTEPDPVQKLNLLCIFFGDLRVKNIQQERRISGRSNNIGRAFGLCGRRVIASIRLRLLFSLLNFRMS